MEIIFMGKSKESTYKALNYILEKKIEVPFAIIPQEDSKLKKLCEEKKIKIITDIELYEMIENKNSKINDIDLVISFLFWKKIKKPIIELGKKGCINLHPAPLPEYRGLGGYNFAIMDELNYWGVTSHFVDEEIDTGKIIKVNKFEIDKNTMTAFELEKISQEELYKLFKETLDIFIENKEIVTTIQGEGKYINRKILEESKEVKMTDTNEEIDKKIRAFWFPPHTGAYIEKDGKKYTLINKELLNKIK